MTRVMTKREITREEIDQLVEFRQWPSGGWYVHSVNGYCYKVKRDCHIVEGNCDYVRQDVYQVDGTVHNTINGRDWQFEETDKETLERLIEEGLPRYMLQDALDQMEED